MLKKQKDKLLVSNKDQGDDDNSQLFWASYLVFTSINNPRCFETDLF